MSVLYLIVIAAIIFFAGMILGIGLFFVIKISGSIVVVENYDSDKPYFFLELEKSPETLMKHDYVIVRIKKKQIEDISE